MVDTPLTMRSPSTCNTFWKTPWVAGWVGPKLSVHNSSCGSLSTKTGLLFVILLIDSLIRLPLTFRRSNPFYPYDWDLPRDIPYAWGTRPYRLHSIFYEGRGVQQIESRRNHTFHVPSNWHHSRAQ